MYYVIYSLPYILAFRLKTSEINKLDNYCLKLYRKKKLKAVTVAMNLIFLLTVL
jgi:hypothetical protein